MRATRALSVIVLLTTVAGCGLGDPNGAAEPPTTAPPTVTYVAIGSGESRERDPDSRRDEVWPRVLFRQHLPPQTVFTDLADDGTTVAAAVSSQLPAALDLHPTVATVWLTSEDVAAGTVPSEYEDSLDDLVGALDDAGAEIALLVGPGTPTGFADAVAAVATAHDAQVVTVTDADDQNAIAARVAAALRLTAAAAPT